jgi:hypothetical protein
MAHPMKKGYNRNVRLRSGRKDAHAMLRTVEGKYSEGRVTLLETPEDLQEGPVLVTFLAEPKSPTEHKPMTFGQFGGSILPTDEDFRIAEWHGGRATAEPDGG